MVHSATTIKLKICVLKQKFSVQNARIENLTPPGASDLQTVVVQRSAPAKTHCGLVLCTKLSQK